MKNTRDRIYLLLAKKLAGEATAQELEEFEKIIRQFPELSYSIQILEALWKSNPGKGDTRMADSPMGKADEGADAYERHRQRLEELLEEQDLKGGGEGGLETGKDLGKRKGDHQGIIVPLYKGNAAMFSLDKVRNYGVVAWRTLSRNKVFSLINISGLAIGMASAILLLLWIQRQFSYDGFHSKKDRTYLVYTRAVINGKIECWPSTPHLLGPALKKEYPQVEDVARANWVGAFVLSNGDKHLQTQGLLTDAGFLKIFDFPLKEGDPNTAFDRAHSILLTEKMAKKLFGDEDALGKTMRVDSNGDFTVTGILKDLPSNTEFTFEYLVPWDYTKEVHWDDSKWANTNIHTYLTLKNGVSQGSADRLICNIVKDHAPEVKNEVFLQPMRNWRLYSEFENGKVSGGMIVIVRLFMIIAGLILLIACINYMNLSTARSAKRAREVGIRKVVGAGKVSLIARFIGESILVAFLSAVLALLIVQASIGWFDQVCGEDLSIPYTSAAFWGWGLGFVLFTGLLAGSYPAFYLSAYKPINVLKGYFKTAHTLVTPRKVLVVMQFTFAIIFIICTTVIYNQLGFVRHRNKGYSQDNLAFIYIKGDIRKNLAPIQNALYNTGLIANLTCTNSPIVDVWNVDDSYSWAGKDAQSRTEMNIFRTSGNFTRTMGIGLVDGRDIDIERYPTDTTAVLLNESAVKLIGWKNAVGKTVSNNTGNWHVVGVVKDFIPGNPFAPVRPMVIEGPKGEMGTISFRLNEGANASAAISQIASIFKRYNPDYPFEYTWVKESYAGQFQGEQHFATLATLFAGLAIFISCLGLFALATYMAESRIREIGVRKVLGASVTRITALLSKDFLVLIFISFVIASPIAWWCMNKWLENYPYHISISWTVFAFTGLLSTLIAASTIGYQSVRAALANPVKSLRTE